MNKYLITIVFIFSINAFVKGQDYLIYQDFGKILIVDYDSKIESKYYQDWEFKNTIELCNNVRKKFVGYNWKSDTLIIFLEDYGKISYMKFKLDSLQNLLTHKIEFKKENQETILYPNKNPYVTYKHGNIKIISRSGGEMKCYIDSSLVWTKECRIKSFSCFIVGGGLWNPKLSQDRKKILMIIDGKLTEVNLLTGKERIITKKSISRYEYSQKGSYIMYRENGEIHIYDTTTSKVIVYGPWLSAFWLYK